MDGRVATFAITHETVSPAAAAEQLGARGFAVWHGDYYAVEIMQRLGLDDGAVRDRDRALQHRGRGRAPARGAGRVLVRVRLAGRVGERRARLAADRVGVDASSRRLGERQQLEVDDVDHRVARRQHGHLDVEQRRARGRARVRAGRRRLRLRVRTRVFPARPPRDSRAATAPSRTPQRRRAHLRAASVPPPAPSASFVLRRRRSLGPAARPERPAGARPRPRPGATRCRGHAGRRARRPRRCSSRCGTTSARAPASRPRRGRPPRRAATTRGR